MGGITARLLEGERRQGKAPWDDYWYNPVGMHTGGVEVTRASVLGLTAVWKAVRLLSQDMAKMTLKLYRTRDDGGRDEARDDPRFWILHRLPPNSWQTPFALREMVQGHQELRGNAFTQKVLNGRGELLHLIPLNPSRMQIGTKAGSLVYEYTRGAGPRRDFEPWEIIHFRGLTDDGVWGYDPLTVLRESFALGIATQRFASKYYENDASPGGVLSTEQIIDDETHGRIKESWNKAHKGVESAHHPAILEAGLTWNEIGISAENAQMIESRRLTGEDVARAFGVPPRKLGASSGDSMTYANNESAEIEYLRDAIHPRAERLEQTLNLALLSEEEIRSGMYFRFNPQSILHLDSAAKAKYGEYKFKTGQASPNDLRRLDEENPRPGGDRYFTAINVIPDDTDRAAAGAGERALPEPRPQIAAAPPAERRQERAAILRNRIRQNHEKLIATAAAGVVGQEVREGREAIERSFAAEPNRSVRRFRAEFMARENRAAGAVDVFRAWVAEFYDGFDERWVKALGPIFLAEAEAIRDAVVEEIGEDEPDTEVEAFADSYTATFAQAKVRNSVNHLDATIAEVEAHAENAGEDPDPEEIRTNLEALLEQWEETRSERIADRESAQLGNAVAWLALGALGVTASKWQNVGDTSPWCRQLDGKVVSRGSFFLRSGEELQEGDEVFRAKQDYRHPPLYRGCSCQVVAGQADS